LPEEELFMNTTAPWILGSIALLTAAAACGSSGASTGSGGTAGAAPSSSSSSGAGLAGTGGTGGKPMYTLCDPFTGLPCDLPGGQSCDWDGTAFSCFAPPNTAQLCDDCMLGNYCAVGLTCLDSNKCSAFCCDDGDCGSGGTCDKTLLGDPGVGVCVIAGSTPDGGTGDGGPGGGGGGGAPPEGQAPACNAPAQPPSMGACYQKP
jgi:hypothetical protein